MRYLALFCQDRPHLGVIAVFDTQTRRWVTNHLGLRTGDHLSSDLEYCLGPSRFYGLLSRHRNLMTAQWTRDSKGQILESEQPKRLSFDEVERMFSDEPSLRVEPPKPCHRRKTTPRTFTQRHTPATIFSPVVIAEANGLKAEGRTWGFIAQKLGVNSESLQATLRKLRRTEAAETQPL